MIEHVLLSISFLSNLIMFAMIAANAVLKNDIKEMLNEHKNNLENDKT